MNGSQQPKAVPLLQVDLTDGHHANISAPHFATATLRQQRNGTCVTLRFAFDLANPTAYCKRQRYSGVWITTTSVAIRDPSS
jgi:hypothetical protein